MYFLGLLIIFLCLIPDLTVHFYVGNFLFKTQLCPLFLCFVVLRKRFNYLVFLLFFYTLIVTSFSGIGFTPLFFSSFIVFVVFYKLRTEIYTESYLVQSVWVFIMIFTQWLILWLIDLPDVNFFTTPFLLMYGLFGSLIAAMISVPLFFLWDHLFLMFSLGRSSSDRGDDFGSMISGKPSSNDLL